MESRSVLFFFDFLLRRVGGVWKRGLGEKEPTSVPVPLLTVFDVFRSSILMRLLFFTVTVCVFYFLLVSMLKQDEPFSIISSHAASAC